MVIHVPPAMLPSWGLMSDPEAVPAKPNQLHQAEGKCKHLKYLIQDEAQWSESCLPVIPPFTSFLLLRHPNQSCCPSFSPHLSLPPLQLPSGRCWCLQGLVNQAAAWASCPPQELKMINLMFIPSSLKEMCLLTSVHPTKIKATYKICPFLAPREPVQQFLSEVLRKDIQAWKRAPASW